MLEASYASDAFRDCSFEICVMDNRGIGKSSVPSSKKSYTTLVMAQDALGVMVRTRQDALGVMVRTHQLPMFGPSVMPLCMTISCYSRDP